MSRVVYKASCWDCNSFYIGKTKRRLQDRKTEPTLNENVGSEKLLLYYHLYVFFQQIFECLFSFIFIVISLLIRYRFSIFGTSFLI